MMCPTFYFFVFVGAVIDRPRTNTVRPCKGTQKALRRKDSLLASSIATATATCHQNNLRLFHHGVVAGSDQIHHLCAAGEGEGR